MITALTMRSKRHEAAHRIRPATGIDRDPYFDQLKKPGATLNPLTIVEIASMGGSISRSQYRKAWYALPEHRDLLDAVATAQHVGWAEA